MGLLWPLVSLLALAGAVPSVVVHVEPPPSARTPFVALSIDAIEPQGWLKQQLTLQADGLGANMPLFYAPVNRSRWLVPSNSSCVDGTCVTSSHGPPKKCGVDQHGGLHETFVYWINGAAPLACVLRRERPQFFRQVSEAVTRVLELHKEPGAWLAAFDDQIPARRDVWASFRLMTALTQFSDAARSTTVAAAAHRAVGAYLSELGVFVETGGGFAATSWAYMRWQEGATVCLWFADHPYTTPSGRAAALTLARTMAARYFDWSAFLTDPSAIDIATSAADPSHPQFKDCPFNSSQCHHGVNVGMALQEPAIRYRLSGNVDYLRNSTLAVKTVWRFHGQASGIYSAEDNLAGLAPSKGTETCTVNEAMLSVFNAAAAADVAADRAMLLDRAESIAVNALPAPWRAGNMWQLQYHHQVNAFAAPQHEHPAGFDPDSLGYGLPYECCASNSEQGWPRYTQLGVAMTAALPTRGLILTGFAPATVRTAGIVVNISSNYPFDDATPIRIEAYTEDAPAFVDIRVPGWCTQATLQHVSCNRSSPSHQVTALNNGTEHRLDLERGVGICVLLHLPMAVRIEQRLHGAVAVYRGPLLYSLPLNFTARTVDSYYPPHGVDESLTLQPGASWRWSLHLPNGPQTKLSFTRRVEPLRTPGEEPALPWSEAASQARGSIRVSVRSIPPELWPAVSCTTNFAHYVS